MRNPWLAKNPFLSIWLSGANSVFGATRSVAAAEMRRQQSRLMAESAKQIMGLWTGGAKTKPRRRQRVR